MSKTASAARGLEPSAVPDQAASAPENDVPTLELTDLVQDSNGEIVLFNDSHLPALAVRALSQPIDTGAVGQHVTAGGDDVTGFRFVAFDDGTRLYYQDSLHLVVLDDLHAAAT
ncbi:MAG TPA: hypothetical protein P5558_00600 [Geminicoccaceae bacterium]|jgi:hypothetical protein|nr:hypothetical protein [Geminicoccaceae bacterium]